MCFVNMKLCYVANSRFPSERAHMTQIVQMCNAFAQNGHEVTLLVTDRKTDILEDPQVYFGTNFLFTVVRISVPDIAGVSIRIPHILRPATFLFQRLVFAVRSAVHIRRESYAYVYGRDEWILWLLTHLVQVPVVWESHEAKFSKVVRLLLAVSKKLIVISEGIQSYYISQGVPEHTILVAHDAVDERFFEPLCAQSEARKLLGITSQKPVVMYIGGLEEWKGAQTLFASAKDEDRFEVYAMGGKSHEKSAFEQKYPWVHFLGFFPYRGLPQYQQAGDILVIPNSAKTALSAEYTSPLKLFTYMTSKKPIIASRIPSITNVLEEHEAFFYTPDDIHSLHDTIISVLENREESVRRAERAFEKSLQYTWKQRGLHIVNFVRS